MENKKQLIIIPPMSEALKKLNEVLEGITTDENMEITLIDDLKEAGQFVTNTGQCIILVSNAKKCATFLQENRFFLAKNHCKTILFTPKEIPAKTLIKFTKIGLTESILESSPPKTFLYKVKLLLRSIKTAKATDDSDKVVKSLDINKPVVEGEVAVKEKQAMEENVIDMDRPKKNIGESDEEAFDYSNPLKGKIKPTEENLDTHWKSDRKKDVASEEAEEEDMTAESSQEAIDMYYRGKRKKTEDAPAEEDDFDKKMAELMAAEEEAKKRNGYQDVIEEGSMKQKRFDVRPEDEQEEQAPSVELDLIAPEKKPDLKKEDITADAPLDFKPKKVKEEEVEKEDKTKDKEVEDLGGYLKGKLSTDKKEEEEQEAIQKKDYDNSDVEKEEKIDFDLLLEEAAKRKQKMDEEAAAAEANPHEGEVDKIDTNMMGDAGTVDKIKNRMEGRSDYEEPTPAEQEDNDFFAKRKRKEEEKKERENGDFNLDLVAGDKENKRPDDIVPEATSDFNNKVKKEAPLEEEKEARKKDVAPEVETTKRERAAIEAPLKDEKERAPLLKKEEEEKAARERAAVDTPDQVKERNTYTGQVDKIDSFYRGGEAAKKKDQNWDNLVDKQTTLDLIPGKSRKAEGGSLSDGKGDQGEVTIDYRKLKEEFDQISREGVASDSGAVKSVGDTTLRNDEDDGSFKVYEIDPKSLDFSINIINSIYQKDVKPKQIFEMLAQELMNSYHCSPVFYTYKLSEKKFTESFNPFTGASEKAQWWNEYKKDNALFEHFQSKSMTTWRCPEIVNNGEVWEDVELPSWAENELKTKQVELIFPYFDGLDRMGMALVFFPEGLDPKKANGLLTVLEMARTLFLDTIQRYQVQPIDDRLKEDAPVEAVPEKKNVLSFFGGLFGKKKAG